MSIARIIASRKGEIITCSQDTTMADAVELLTERRIGAMPVTDPDGRVVGIFSERDVIRCLKVHGGDALALKLDAVMTSPAVTVTADTSENQALALMTRRRIRHLPVVENDRMVGFVSIGDLVKARIDEIEHEAKALRDYIYSA
ncbi:CBS domain-containing protein [Croceicoccus ponticola]|uniref:CBS domain-containing protein n=1 Tax=Croceicoccus ponticola TaxID=2217664 RepID=A0A437GYI8_9SPHN|nr:CBS domain-containing protein [Croceicoccus ponticola]RVQ67741.1 CBS domain-containing protein [Croceicoccus ponticola]